MNKMKKEYTRKEKSAKMKAALLKAFPDDPELNEKPVSDPEETTEEKPKKVYKRKTKAELVERAEAAQKKAEEKAEKRRLKEVKKAEREAKIEEKLLQHWQREKQKLATEREREFKKFNCPELIRMFGGWFTLTYAFSIKTTTKVKNVTRESETDYYICSQDCSQIDVNKRPGLNKAIKREFDKDVYGFAIIAPASAFGEGGAMV